MTEFRFTSEGQTHVGCVRTANEDSLLVREDAGLWVVADGMGGHSNGAWASAGVVEGLNAVELTGPFDADADKIQAAIRQANATIVEMAEKSGKQIGSTVVALYLKGAQYACLWAGDSRAYRLREGELAQLTRDHSAVQDLVDRGLIGADQARHHPMSNVVTRAIGVDHDAHADMVAGDIAGGDVFLLCSDGLMAVASNEEIALELVGRASRTATQRLIEMALSRGAPDNITVIIVACEPVTAVQPAGLD
ncbi:MAG TPA: protein phosphatase 2C domain-containing protein [Caulobacteraceae bacterium]|jgi:serine/threonine protein phosphatase PrpC|nr:protein phosphatase 2C domain-containing protein [Caulobacteraceae bacterium]